MSCLFDRIDDYVLQHIVDAVASLTELLALRATCRRFRALLPIRSTREMTRDLLRACECGDVRTVIAMLHDWRALHPLTLDVEMTIVAVCHMLISATAPEDEAIAGALALIYARSQTSPFDLRVLSKYLDALHAYVPARCAKVGGDFKSIGLLLGDSFGISNRDWLHVCHMPVRMDECDCNVFRVFAQFLDNTTLEQIMIDVGKLRYVTSPEDRVAMLNNAYWFARMTGCDKLEQRLDQFAQQFKIVVPDTVDDWQSICVRAQVSRDQFARAFERLVTCEPRTEVKPRRAGAPPPAWRANYVPVEHRIEHLLHYIMRADVKPVSSDVLAPVERIEYVLAYMREHSLIISGATLCPDGKTRDIECAQLMFANARAFDPPIQISGDRLYFSPSCAIASEIIHNMTPAQVRATMIEQYYQLSFERFGTIATILRCATLRGATVSQDDRETFARLLTDNYCVAHTCVDVIKLHGAIMRACSERAISADILAKSIASSRDRVHCYRSAAELHDLSRLLHDIEARM